jgi:NhaP-type Na+/H+ and K+/H+ antiporter
MFPLFIALALRLFAIGLVLATKLAAGALLKLLVPDIPLPIAIAFGAIVSPPDAVAATAILSRLSIPRRIVTLLEGESLVNDASGLVLCKIAIDAALTGSFASTSANSTTRSRSTAERNENAAAVSRRGAGSGQACVRSFALSCSHSRP